VTKLVVFCG